MTNAIDPNLLLSSVQTKQKTGSNTLGKDDFLKLLMAQLQNQDPLNPLEDKEFISQMATFTSLEQMISMKESVDAILKSEREKQQMEYLPLIGKDITWHRMTYGEDEEPIIEQGTGKISAIQFSQDGPLFYLEDGTELTAGNISEIHHQGFEDAIVQASYLIGKQVTWNRDGEEKTAVVTAVIRKNGQIYYQLNDEKTTAITADSIISVSERA